ncbi:MAG: hypothetical protein ACE5RC_00110, partial [Nitrosopumilus sp.]
ILPNEVPDLNLNSGEVVDFTRTEIALTENRPLLSNVSNYIMKDYYDPPENVEPEESTKETPSAVVVVSLDKLHLRESLKVELSQKHDEKTLNEAVERVMKWTGRNSDEAAIRTVLDRKSEWNDVLTERDKLVLEELEKIKIQNRVEENRQKGEDYCNSDYPDLLWRGLVNFWDSHVDFNMGDGHFPLGYAEENFMDTLKKWISKIKSADYKKFRELNP